MMAYIRDLPRPKCADCRTAPATKELFNWQNGAIRTLCARCAPRALKSLQQSEVSLRAAHFDAKSGKEGE